MVDAGTCAGCPEFPKPKIVDDFSQSNDNEPRPVGLAVIHGALGLGLLLVGYFFPVHWHLQHPAVVKQASLRDADSASQIPSDESVLDFTERVISYGSNGEEVNHFAHPARLSLIAAEQIHGENEKKAEIQALWKKLPPPAATVTDYLLTSAGREAYRRALGASPSDGVLSILNVWRERPQDTKTDKQNRQLLQNHYPSILLSAWLHHNHKLGHMGKDVVQLCQKGNAWEALHKFFNAMTALADRLDGYQLARLTDVMPDMDTFEKLSQISMVQTLLPPFHSIGNNADLLDEGKGEHVITPDELKKFYPPLARYFDDINTTNKVQGIKEITLEEWVQFGRMPLEITHFPLTYTAVTWPGEPEATRQVVNYLMKHGRRGDADLKRAMRHGHGALLHLVQSEERISPRGSEDALSAMATFSLNHPRWAGFVRLLLMVLGGALLLRLFTLLNPVTLASPADVTLFRWRRRATAFLMLTVLVILGEPVLFQPAASSEYEVAVKVPIAANPKDNPNKDNTMLGATESSDTAANITMIVLFTIAQVIVYMTFLRRMREIRDGSQTPQQKLKLLENEDNLFDLGLYIGIAGTALGLGLIMLDLFTKPYAAYVSNILGIACVAVVKIHHLRNTRQELLLEAGENK